MSTDSEAEIESDEEMPPSRSQRRREALDVRALAVRLVAQNEGELARLPLSDDQRALVRETQRITQQIAHKRQLQFLAKHLRRETPEALDALRQLLEHDKLDARRETAALHRVEAWRERLLTDGDTALAELIDTHPTIDRQQLRQLIRNARDERQRDKPLHAYRELFRALREVLDHESPSN